MLTNQDTIFEWLTQYTYQPHMVYLAVAGILLASAFGFPVPEEVPIVSIGLLSYMGAHPEDFPPPVAGASVVNGYEAAVILLLAIVAADCLVFGLGRLFGRKLVQNPYLAKVFSQKRLDRINGWLDKYGSYAVFIFRFTPGLRFPAHIILGMSTVPLWQFLLVDSFAAFVSVPTQIVLIYHFGKPIITTIHEFRDALAILAGLVILGAIGKIWLWPKLKNLRR
jgi:membrane protein DedA with SNARE-associated domain